MEEVKLAVENLNSEWNQFKKEYKNQHDNKEELNMKHENLEDEIELKSFSIDDADRGQVTVTPDRYSKILEELKKVSPLRKLSSNITISSNAIDFILQNGSFNSGWVSERGARDETDTPQLKSKKISVNEIYAQPKATQRLINDESVNFSEWLTSQIIESFSRVENTAFINGDGDNKPKGILSYDDEISILDAEEKENISVLDLIKLINSLDDFYHEDAAFLMNRRTFAAIQNLKDDEGRHIWQNILGDKVNDRIMGFPVYCTSDMPALAEDAKSIVFGSFKQGYKIVDREGINIMKDPFTEKPFVKFYATKRVGGDVIDFQAFKILKT